MSQRLISRSRDLKRLRDEGYTVEVRAGHLLIHNVPYVTSTRKVRLGTLVSTLTLAGDVTQTPDTHVAYFIGEQPCNKAGVPIQQIRHTEGHGQLAEHLSVDRSFSNKPKSGYTDYYHKMSTYAAILSGPAEALDPRVTAKAFIAIKSDDQESVFKYVDTASSRAGISAVSRKLALDKIALIGTGGTGAYILDLVAKTPAQEIHLFDGDRFLQHNAFRVPGAPSLATLKKAPHKVTYLRQVYSRMRRGIFAHRHFLTRATAHKLEGMSFAFVSMDGGPAKEVVIEALEKRGIPFIDVGVGVHLVEDRLLGIVRTTTSTAEKRWHVRDRKRISFSEGEVGDEYKSNIQIADLNALNATLAVIKWKKLCGFYLDLEREHHSTYTIDGNHLINDDQIKDNES